MKSAVVEVVLLKKIFHSIDLKVVVDGSDGWMFIDELLCNNCPQHSGYDKKILHLLDAGFPGHKAGLLFYKSCRLLITVSRYTLQDIRSRCKTTYIQCDQR